MQVVRYSEEWKEGWNRLVRESRNGSFFCSRGYIDMLDADDCSLLFAEGDNILGVLPANYEEGELTVYSHEGIAYGGLVLSVEATAANVLQMMDELTDYYQGMGACHIVYRMTPYIYSSYPSQEDLFALYRHGARLLKREIISVVSFDHPLPMRALRKRRVKSAIEKGLYIEKSKESESFLRMINDGARVSVDVGGAFPSGADMIWRSALRLFPENVHLFTVRSGGDCLAGALLYHTPRAVKLELTASTPRGMALGAPDLLMNYLLRERFLDVAYFDLGVTARRPVLEDTGYVSNFRLEDFGARGAAYDQYIIDL